MTARRSIEYIAHVEASTTLCQLCNDDFVGNLMGSEKGQFAKDDEANQSTANAARSGTGSNCPRTRREFPFQRPQDPLIVRLTRTQAIHSDAR